MNISRNEYEYARIVAAQSGKPLDKVVEEMVRARDVHGVPFRDYQRIELHKYTEKTVISNGERLTKAYEAENRHYEEIGKEMGWTRAQIRANMAALNDNPYAKVDIVQYHELGLYKMDPRSLETILRDLRDRVALLKQLSADLKKIDRGEKAYEDIGPALTTYYRVTRNTVLASDIEEFREMIEKAAPELFEDEEQLRTVVADMLVCKRLMGFWDFEYFMFNFREKSIQERRTFVSNNYRTLKLNKVNDRLKNELFDNKASTYEAFQKYYGREVIIVNGREDLPRFKQYCKKYERFVKKPINGAMGSGIGIVKTGRSTDLERLFTELLDDLGPFVCEEVIQAHPAIKKLNPDSVNTVRLCTYFDGSKVHMKWPFMKIGRAGSFVDNGGAGGILVAIDEKSGKFVSDGIDEACSKYTIHPDNGVSFRGYQLPNWADVAKLGERIALTAYEKIPEVRFIGWDITCDANGNWVVVEGNALTQFIGQQAPLEKGVRAELDAMIPD